MFSTKIKYCSNCGSDDLKDQVPAGDDRERQVCSNCGTIHYANPKMVVGCLVVQDGKVLMAKRNIEPRKGYWNLPCGFLENNETAVEGAVREVWEECLAKVEVDGLHCTYDLVGVHQVYLIYRAHMTEAGFGTTLESSEVCFMSPEEIPWDELAFISSKFALKKWIENSDEKPTKIHMGSFEKYKS